MSEEDLNVKYIREKTGLVENDELIPIILEMIKDSYKAGLCQAEYDNTMDLMEENAKYKDVIDKAIECISELDDNTDDTTCYDIDKYTRDYILSILKEVE